MRSELIVAYSERPGLGRVSEPWMLGGGGASYEIHRSRGGEGAYLGVHQELGHEGHGPPQGAALARQEGPLLVLLQRPGLVDEEVRDLVIQRAERLQG